jgi:hypothetical protein
MRARKGSFFKGRQGAGGERAGAREREEGNKVYARAARETEWRGYAECGFVRWRGWTCAAQTIHTPSPGTATPEASPSLLLLPPKRCGSRQPHLILVCDVGYFCHQPSRALEKRGL